MKFTGLWVENFLSVVKAETYLNDRGLVLIQGNNEDAQAFDSNGAGKSTLFSESIVWCLYGETIRGQKGDAVVNKNVKRNTRVRLGIEDDNGDEYLIVRHRKDKDYKNAVHLYRNGENITAKSDTDTNKMIVDLIEMDFLSFTNSILFGQGISKMFASATDSEQKKILERMLRIDIFKDCQDRAKEHLTNVKNRMDAIEAEIESNSKQMVTLEQTVEDLQTKEAELATKVEAKIAELEEELVKYDSQMSALPALDELVSDTHMFTELIEKLDEQIKGYELYETSKSQWTSESMLVQKDIDRTGKLLKDTNKRLQDLLSGNDIPAVCNACGQEIPKDDTSALEAHIRQEIEFHNQELELQLFDLQCAKDLVDSATETLKGKEELEKQRKDLKQALDDTNTDIKVTHNQMVNLKKLMGNIVQQIEDQKSQLDTTYTELIEGHITQIKALRSIVDNEIVMLEEETELHNKYNFWVNGFGNQGIKSVLLDSVTPYLNERANKYLSHLADSTIEVLFNTQTELKSGEKRDKFSVEITNTNGDDDYKGNSNGEKRRIDLAVNMSLQDLVGSRSNKSIDLVVYDEAFEGLDEVGCENLIQILQEKAGSIGTIMVITHNPYLKELFTKSITVRKENKQTVIQEEAV